ncbi:MAG TPA: hypothetical protein PLI59_17195 [Candidatus Obscuribacter sp.]|nr:hypothetical protein [Candidatus Obscuribacter sp.]HMX46096.1 hypothetical protein [Candidatus Obscuribacter sp.]HNA73260.1 hypothetical protein [Candidatus Obscuribacter sp.]HND08287.1 hypothetical protein [Candidatus Obscuribacter sp.]HND68669.1 hypothetical protein [Candidatus Obscuribacter sp.]
MIEEEGSRRLGKTMAGLPACLLSAVVWNFLGTGFLYASCGVCFQVIRLEVPYEKELFRFFIPFLIGLLLSRVHFDYVRLAVKHGAELNNFARASRLKTMCVAGALTWYGTACNCALLLFWMMHFDYELVDFAIVALIATVGLAIGTQYYCDALGNPIVSLKTPGEH